MKPQTFNEMKMTRLSNLPLVLLVSLMLSLTFVLPNVRAQQQQLGLADIIIALRSNKVTLAERNEILTGAVKERGITFELTPQIEKELENTGADKALIEAIRQKTVVVKITPTPQPKPTPAATPTPVQQDFAFYKKQADDNVSKGEIEFALTNYNKAAELNPENPSIYLNRALAFYKKKDYEKAIADYDKVIEINPKEVLAYSSRANSYEKLGNTDKAVADYKKILEIDDKNESAINNLKRIEDERARVLQKQKDEALAAQTDAAKDKPKEETKPKEEPTSAPTETSDGLQTVNLGRLSSTMATEMSTPIYSQLAKNLNLQGQVTVQVLINEEGKVTEAGAIEGHRLLRESAEQAARKSKFKPILVDGKPVKAKGYIVYNFVR